jgi:hypothetical protein
MDADAPVICQYDLDSASSTLIDTLCIRGTRTALISLAQRYAPAEPTVEAELEPNYRGDLLLRSVMGDEVLLQLDEDFGDTDPDATRRIQALVSVPEWSLENLPIALRELEPGSGEFAIVSHDAQVTFLDPSLAQMELALSDNFGNVHQAIYDLQEEGAFVAGDGSVAEIEFFGSPAQALRLTATVVGFDPITLELGQSDESNVFSAALTAIPSPPVSVPEQDQHVASAHLEFSHTSESFSPYVVQVDGLFGEDKLHPETFDQLRDGGRAIRNDADGKYYLANEQEEAVEVMMMMPLGSYEGEE